MVGELKLLSYRFQNLKFSKNYKKELKSCIDRHIELMESKYILEQVFGALAIYLAVTCAIVLCALIFQATETKSMSVLKVCYLICYSFLKLVQAYSYAWFGNIINVESQACLDSIYNAYWTDSGDLQFMNDVLIILSQKPFSFKAKGVMILELDVFSKVCILITNEKDLRDLNEGISTRFENDLKVSELRPHLLAHFQTFFKLYFIYNVLLCTSIFLLYIMPLLALRNNKYLRVYPQLLPFNYEPGGIIHWSIYGFELLCGYYLWTVTSGVDSVFGLYALHMVGELRVLGSSFQNLRSSTNYRNDLKKCIEKHRLLIQSRYKLEQVFSFLALWLAVTCAIAMCALVFQATQLKNRNIVRLIYLTGHFILKLVQAYSYAWYGNIIAVESSICLDSIYKARWPGSGNTRFMKDVLIILSQKPQIFKVKGWLSVRLDMFLKILHATISYFFLLQTLQEHPDNFS